MLVAWSPERSIFLATNGEPVARYAPQVKPDELEAPIRKLL
jgi:glutathione peroxidase-family protein